MLVMSRKKLGGTKLPRDDWLNEYEREVDRKSTFFSYSAERCGSAQAPVPSMEGGAGRG